MRYIVLRVGVSKQGWSWMLKMRCVWCWNVPRSVRGRWVVGLRGLSADTWLNRHCGQVSADLWSLLKSGDIYLSGRNVSEILATLPPKGSINPERSEKCLRYDILSLKCNHLSDNRAVIRYRASENLRHLMIVQMLIDKRVANSPLGAAWFDALLEGGANSFLFLSSMNYE